jgi:Family of unknown function (DUF5317)
MVAEMKRELRLHFPSVHLRWGVLALFALVLQATAIFVPLGFDDIPKRLLFVLSYLLLLCFIARNLPRAGIAIIGIGVLLNLLPIVTNGGLMPVTAENLAKAGQTQHIEGRREGDAIPYSKNVLRARDDTHFYELSDRIVWDNAFFFRVFSLGDVVIAGGLLVTLGDLFLPRVRRETRQCGNPSRVNP